MAARRARLRKPPGTGRARKRAISAGEGALGGEQGPPPLGQGEGVEEGDPGKLLVVAPGRGGRLLQPPPELPAAGGRHPVEVAAGAPAGAEDPEQDPTLPPHPGEGGVDLGEAGAPRGVDFVLQRAREVVPGARRFAEQAEEHVGERHAGTISI